MASLLGAGAALGSSLTWAYASTRYAQASRVVGSLRVNQARALVVLPIYLTAAALGGAPLQGMTGSRLGWLAISVLCSYGFGDALFYVAAGRIGVTTALSIASTYPLWAAVAGAVAGTDRFGPAAAAGTVLCIAGVAALIQLAPRPAGAPAGARDLAGIGLALATSLLWAGNAFATRHGATGITVWQANAVRYALALALLSGTLAARRPSAAPAPPGGWRALVPAVLVDAFAGSVCFVYGLANSSLAAGATLSSLAPLVSVPIAIGLGEERWSPARLAAVAVTVGGVIALVALG